MFLDLWEPADSIQDLENKVLEKGILPDVTSRRARNLVAEMWAPRFSPHEFTGASDMKAIMDRLSRSSIQQFFCLFTARAQLIVREFITQLYWPTYEGGRSVLSRDEVETFILDAMDEGKMAKRWSESTVRRVTGYLTGTAMDFGFVEKASRSSYELTPPTIDEKLAIYLAYDLHFSGLSDGAVLSHVDWLIWGMNAEDVLKHLQFLGRNGHFIVQGSIELVRLNWAYKSREEVLDAINR